MIEESNEIIQSK